MLSKIWYWIRFAWFAVILRLFYWTHIRQLWNKFCQMILDQGYCRRPLPKFEHPDEVWEYMKDKFQYRQDPGNGMFDYFSDPEVFHWKLLNQDTPDGDCDDVARFAAACIAKIKGTTHTYILHTAYEGGAHATVVFKYLGSWYHFDYGVKGCLPGMAPKNVMMRYTKSGYPHRLLYWGFERLDMTPVLISPTLAENIVFS